MKLKPIYKTVAELHGHGLKQTEIAKYLGIDPAQISRWFRKFENDPEFIKYIIYGIDKVKSAPTVYSSPIKRRAAELLGYGGTNKNVAEIVRVTAWTINNWKLNTVFCDSIEYYRRNHVESIIKQWKEDKKFSYLSKY